MVRIAEDRIFLTCSSEISLEVKRAGWKTDAWLLKDGYTSHSYVMWNFVSSFFVDEHFQGMGDGDALGR